MNESPVQVVLVPMALTGWRKWVSVIFQVFVVAGLLLSCFIMLRALMMDLDVGWSDVKKTLSKLAFWKRKSGPVAVPSPAQGGNR